MIHRRKAGRAAAAVLAACLLFSACGVYIRYKVNRMKQELNEETERGIS